MHTRLLITTAAAALACSAALAQYKVVGPNGKITYTDTPPDSPNVKAVGHASGDAAETENLPYELRQVVARYPVTLLTSSNCSPCDSARSFLRQRGVPFSEKTVNTAQDAAILQRNEGSNDLPVVRIGAQQLKGFRSSDLGGYLDAAGYPKQSKLPVGYKFRDATPLAPPAEVKPAQAEAAPPPAPAPAPSPTPPVDSGPPPPIKF